MNEGLIIYPAGGCVDGRSGVHILLAPPYIYNESHVDELIEKLTRTIDVSLF